MYFSFLLFFSPAPIHPSCVTFLLQVRTAFVCLLVSLSHVVSSAVHWFQIQLSVSFCQTPGLSTEAHICMPDGGLSTARGCCEMNLKICVCTVCTYTLTHPPVCTTVCVSMCTQALKNFGVEYPTTGICQSSYLLSLAWKNVYKTSWYRFCENRISSKRRLCML